MRFGRIEGLVSQELDQNESIHTKLKQHCIYLRGSEQNFVKVDGWMICNFRSFSTVFQLYQDNGWMIMKGCVQWHSVYG